VPSLIASIPQDATLLLSSTLSKVLVAASFLVLSCSLVAQTAHFGYVATVLPTNGLVWPSAVAVDAAGDVFITDQNTGSISELVAGASTLVVAHTGLTAPEGIAVDSTGDLYVSQQGSASLTVYPVGGGAPTTLGAGLNQPIGLVLDGLGNIYVADSGNHRVKKIAIANGAVTLVGTGWSIPCGVALDAAGNLYVADQGTYSVVKVATNGVQSTVIYPFYAYGVTVDPSGDIFSSTNVGGNTVLEVPLGGSQETFVSSSASIAGTSLAHPEGMAVDSTGSVYLADLNNGRVIKFQTGGIPFPATAVSTTSSPIALSFTFNTGGAIGVPVVLTQGATGLDYTDAGTGTCTTNGTSHSYSTGDSCTVNVVFTPQYPTARLGAVLLVDGSANVLATAYLDGVGTGSEMAFNPAITSPPLHSTLFNIPVALVVDGRGIGAGNVYIADEGNNQILKVDPSGNVTVFAGTGVTGFSGDGGPAISARFNIPSDIVMDGAGNLYVADYNNSVVRKIDTKGKISTVVGIGGSYGDGASGGLATATLLGGPKALTFDPQGNLYVVDYYYSKVRKVDHSGIITTVAGTGVPGYTGDGGPATAARLNYPLGARTDDQGHLYISDTYNNLIRKIDTSGTITTVAGTYDGDVGGYSGDGGPATSARLHTPYDLAVDAAGELFICDSGNSVLRRVDSSGNISTYGTPLSFPEDAVVDKAGNLALIDSTAKALLTISRTQPAPLNFGTLNVGSTSSAQTVNVSNIGNTALTFPVPSAGLNPSTTAGFSLSNSSTCPQISSSSNPATLAVGASCTELISLTPTVPGSLSGSLVMTDDSLKAPGLTYGTQTIPLTGTATAPATATTFTAAPNPAFAGQPVTLTATVTPTPIGTPLGTVSFYNGSTLLGMATLNSSGVATFIGGLPVGALSITAVYSGNQGFLTSTSTAQTVNVSATATSSILTEAPNPVLAGQSATFTLTIAPVPTGSPLGTVTFHNGSTLLGTGTVNSSGVATFSTTTLPPGTDSITAAYSGNSAFASSTSTAITVQVNSANATATVTALTSSNLAPTYGQSITLTATITPAPTAAPPGSIKFYAGTTLLGAQAVNTHGVGTLSLSLPLGLNAITAVYSGSAGFAASKSSPLSVSARALSAITFSANPTTQLATMPVVFTAQVNSATAGVQTGTVSFLNGSTVLATVTIVPGQPAVYSESGLSSGTYSVTASYSGDGNFLPGASTGAPVSITVSDLDLALGGDNNKSVVPGSAVTYNFPLSPVVTSTFIYSVALTATGLPPGATYTFSPSTIPAGSGTLPVAFTVQTAKTTAMLHRTPGSSRSPWFALLFGLLLPLAGAKRFRARLTTSSPQRAWPRMLLLLLFGALSLGLVAGLGGCGSGGFLGTPPGQTSYTITISATSGTLVRTSTVQLNLE
jgi:sugar lactone lactonase YvrE